MSNTNADVSVEINGLEKVNQIANDLQATVEKTKALAGALVKACDELNITFDEH